MADGIPEFNEQTQWAKVRRGLSEAGGENFNNMNKAPSMHFKDSKMITARAGMATTKAEGGTPHDPWVFRYPNAKM